MPTYQNNETNTSYMVRDIYDEMTSVKPGETIQTFEDVSDKTGLVETDASPANRASITAENTFTDAVRVKRGTVRGGTLQLNMSISGVSDSTVTLQRSEDDGTTWTDVEEFTESAERLIQDARETTVYRLGVKTGNYGTDTVVVALTK
jgi:hypothetical protein